MVSAKRKLLAALVGIGLSSTVFFTPTAVEAAASVTEYQQEAEVLLADAKYDKLVKLYNQALQKYPDFADFYAQRGKIFVYTGEAAKAAADFNKALQLDKSNLNAILGKAVMKSCEGKMKQAWPLFEQAVALEPDNPKVYRARGVFYYQGIADYPHAIADIDKAINLSPENEKFDLYDMKIDLEFTYAGTYNKSFYEQIISDTATILAIPDIPQEREVGMHRVKGLAYAELGKYEAALVEFNQAIKLTDDADRHAKLLSLQADVYHRMGDFKQEEIAWQAALKQDATIKLPRKYEKNREVMLK